MSFRKLPFALSLFAFCLLAASLGACHHQDDEVLLKETADSFATNYYNWRFEAAKAYCTPESGRWLRYAASQVHQEDVDVLKAQAQGAKCEIQDIAYADNDTTATVNISVRDFLRMDTIGTVAHLTDEASYTLTAVRRNEKWKVALSSLPRALKEQER
ncbi:hypothetical protein SAMN06298210_11312 [Prevotellaceae bacterium KH2P17]|nr:hypothetical protein SAMN06298210_11312 [Prevotellaceae bacterium KH2P17]